MLCPSAAPTAPGTEMLTMREPEAFRKSRREVVVMSGSLGAHRLGSTLDRAHDRHVRAAAALDARHRLADLRVARLGIGLEEGGGGHDPAGETVAALRDLL